MQNIIRKMTGLALGLSLLSGAVSADWALDNEQSKLYYASTKKDTISEINSFKTLSGSISDTGTATVNIDLNSVDTKVEIRDQRMGKYFFETDKFSTATATVELGDEGIKPGTHDVTVKLGLHGVEQEVAAKVLVMEEENKVTVLTVAPVVINSTDFNLDDGIEMLKKLAQLPSINKAVPVTFLLTFAKE
uniref:Polyisoprenoid-binding protein YceI n=1 Tax=uncultured Thiotrichaceae bacterium TaxID=298394 RepID=A0A6S6UB66_9GAMM|nr:MAG: Polyisoprenoid-binding protein YceI [uncultured Thiotrichaceae bacterium]